MVLGEVETPCDCPSGASLDTSRLLRLVLEVLGSMQERTKRMQPWSNVETPGIEYEAMQRLAPLVESVLEIFGYQTRNTRYWYW